MTDAEKQRWIRERYAPPRPMTDEEARRAFADPQSDYVLGRRTLATLAMMNRLGGGAVQEELDEAIGLWPGPAADLGLTAPAPDGA